MTTAGFDPDLYGAVDDVFGRRVDPTVIAAAETDGMSASLWSTVADLGFPLVGVDDARGGSGGSIMDALAIAVLAGHHAVPLPIVETHLAAWLLAGAGLDVTAEPMTVAPGTDGDEVVVEGGSVRGVVHDVAWVPGATKLVVVTEAASVVVIDPARAEIEIGHDLAGQPRSVVRFAGAEHAEGGAGLSPRALQLRGALLRAGQLAGAQDSLAELTIGYCAEREQFGRPLHAFQAVQQHLVTLAQSAELSSMAVLRAGLAALEREASFEICCAKLVADQCAADAVRAAHQAHGAISMTLEYRAQLITRRLNAWRFEFGTEADLALELGNAVAGTDSFFATVVEERATPEVATCPAP